MKLHRDINRRIFQNLAAGATAVLKNTKLFHFRTHLQRKLEECAKLSLYRVYQTDWSGFEVDYIHKYGEQNYKY